MDKKVELTLTDAQAIQDLFECNPFPHYRTPAMQRAIENFYQAIEKKKPNTKTNSRRLKNDSRI